MKESTALNSMQIILHAGDAREATTEALNALKEFDISKARECLKKADEEIV